MKALVYRGPGQKAIEDRPKPEIQAAGDAIVKVVKTTICGTDLHILKGHVPTCAPGRILGHEGVGVVDSVGAGVTAFRKGDRVLISCVSSCGKCEYCRRGGSWCRYGNRGRRYSRDIFFVPGRGGAWWRHREHRGARAEGRSSPRATLVAQHCDHDASGGYRDDAHAVENRAVRQDRSDTPHYASVQARPDNRGL